jgi:general secretion pathway protein G
MPTSAPLNRDRTPAEGFTPSWRSAQDGFTSSRRSAQQGFTPLWRSAEHGFTPLWRSAEHGFTPLWRSAEHGFTLIEMLVVLAVLGLVAALAAQNIGRRPAGLIREEGEAKLDLALDTARREAARSGVAQSVDPAVLIPGASLSGALPARVPRQGLIVIYPDGSSNGGLVSAAGVPVARIDWLTGEARDAS